MVVQALILKRFDPRCLSILETDSSDLVTGEILPQYNNDGVFHLLILYTKCMIFAECNYLISDK